MGQEHTFEDIIFDIESEITAPKVVDIMDFARTKNSIQWVVMQPNTFGTNITPIIKITFKKDHEDLIRDCLELGVLLKNFAKPRLKVTEK